MIILPEQASDWQPHRSPGVSLLSPLPLHDLKWDFRTSASHSSWDSGDGTSSVEPEDLTSTFNKPWFQRSISLNRGGIEIVTVVGSNALGLKFTSEVDDVLRPESKAIPTSRPQAESLRAPHSHQDNCSRDISNQVYDALQEHLAHQPKSQADKFETLVEECPQDICLRAEVGNTIGLKSKLNMSRPKAHPYPGYCGPCADDGTVKWSDTHGQGQGSAADTFSTCAADAQPFCNTVSSNGHNACTPFPSCCPRRKVIEEGDGHLFNGGPGPHDQLTGALDGTSNSMAHNSESLELSFPSSRDLTLWKSDPPCEKDCGGA